MISTIPRIVIRLLNLLDGIAGDPEKRGHIISERELKGVVYQTYTRIALDPESSSKTEFLVFRVLGCEDVMKAYDEDGLGNIHIQRSEILETFEDEEILFMSPNQP